MSESNKGGGLGSIFMLLTLLVGGVALESQLKLQGSRPVLDSKIHHHQLDEEDVEARLWQDPFQAVDQYVKSHQKEHDHGDDPPLSRWLKFKENLKLKTDALKESEKILVLGVMVSSGAYFVDAEDRIRTRYAVVSGLMKSGYRSATSEYIGYLEGKKWKHVHGKLPYHYAHHHMPYRVPYEWFVRADKDPENPQEPLVLVLWLDDRHIFHEENRERRPLKNIQVFFQHLIAEAKEKTPSAKHESNSESHSHATVKTTVNLEEGDYSKYRFAVIGPTNSGQLGDMVGEGSHDKFQGPVKNTPNIQILSARATKDEQQILKKVLGISSSLSILKYAELWGYLNEQSFLFLDSTQADSKFYIELVKGIEKQDQVFQRIPGDPSNLSISKYFKEKNVRFLRTTPTDLKLAHAMVKELQLRGVTRNSPIALVSEFDTDYGRAFKETICKAWIKTFYENEENRVAGKASCDNIHYFGYLRGLDGQIPESTVDEKKDSKKGSPLLNLVPEDVATLRAEQVRQYDYLLRLASVIKGNEKKLLPYKKVMLPAMFENLNFEILGIKGGEMTFPPQMFQNPRFEAFGILGSDYYDKLVVLQALRKQFTRAHFFTTDMDARLFHVKDYKYIRNLIVASGFGLRLRDDLQRPIPPFRDTYQTSAFLATRLALEPEKRTEELTQDQLDEWLQPRIFEIGRTQAFDLSEKRPPQNKILNMFQFSGDSGSAQKAENLADSLHPPRASLFMSYKYPGFVILAVLLVLLLCWKFKEYWQKIVWTIIVLGGYMMYVVLWGSEVDEEPLAFFEGVSIWPTDLFRLAGVVVAVLFIQVFNQRFLKCLDIMKDTFEHTGEKKKVNWFPQNSKDFWWEVGKRSAIFIVIGFMVLWVFGFPFIPVRGAASAVVDKIILGSFILAFGVSLFYAGVKLNESIDLIQKFKPGQWTWTDKTAGAVFKNLEIAAFPKPVRPILNDLISLRFIGLRTDVADELIYYPFGIIALGILSRNRVFDSWDFPLTLLSIFGFGALYILIKAFKVQRKAKKRKEEVVGFLKMQLIQFKAAGMEKEEELTELLTADTEKYKEGAFLPFAEHPFFKAMLLPFSGFGGMAVLEYIFLAV